MKQSLFRREAITAHESQWMGTVLLARPITYRFFTAFAIGIVVVLLLFLFFGEFTRKAQVNGWLVPHQGLVKVFASQGGTVQELTVTEGQSVSIGESLLVLATEQQSAAMGLTQTEIVRQIEVRRNSLSSQRLQTRRLFSQQQSALDNKLTGLRDEVNTLKREITLQQRRVKIGERSASRHRELFKEGHLSELQFQQKMEELLDQKARLHNLERSQQRMAREIVSLEAELKDHPLKMELEIATIERQLAALEQELAETEARRRIIVPAPQSGTVTSILVERGSTVQTSVPLLSIVPEGSTLVAQLFSPSRTIGFVRSGQQVLLRYQAFPYQKFGHYSGTIKNISRSAVAPNEMPSSLSGLSSLYGQNEPFYRITVELETQSVTTYGEQRPLQPGMQLEAHILLDKRRLYEWLLDPLYTITGKMGA